jgi:hypothetical protein
MLADDLRFGGSRLNMNRYSGAMLSHGVGEK